jgi:hypothetical protein
VQDAINHNKALFRQRMWLEDSAILRKCMNAWRAARYGNVQKQTILLRAINRIRVRVCVCLCVCVCVDNTHELKASRLLRQWKGEK